MLLSAGIPGMNGNSPLLRMDVSSITHYETLESFGSASLVEVHLETGRTHQIRVHFSSLRHPVAATSLMEPTPGLAPNLA